LAPCFAWTSPAAWFGALRAACGMPSGVYRFSRLITPEEYMVTVPRGCDVASSAAAGLSLTFAGGRWPRFAMSPAPAVPAARVGLR